MTDILEVKEESQLQWLENESHHRAVLLYKHSQRCGTSLWAQRQVEAYRRQAGGAVPPLAQLDVVEHRTLARQVAKRYGVRHQSPQLLLIKNGQVVWHGSHGDLECSAIAAAVAAHQAPASLDQPA